MRLIEWLTGKQPPQTPKNSNNMSKEAKTLDELRQEAKKGKEALKKAFAEASEKTAKKAADNK